MAEEKKPTTRPADSQSESSRKGGYAGGKRDHNKRESGKGRPRPEREIPEFDSKTIEIARVTRVMAGGKRMRFRALVVLGDRKGRIGFGLSKGADVTIAINKSTAAAKKTMKKINLIDGTIAHPIEVKYKSAKVLLKPAPAGTGLKAGGAVRIVLDLAGLQNIVSKIMGSNNKVNNVKATIIALQSLKKVKA